MNVEVLYFDDCPNYERVLPRLRELLAEAGFSDEVKLRRIESREAAEAERFIGSPTVRIDGSDVEPGADERSDFGLKCRLFRTPQGMSSTLPVEWLRAALGRTKVA